MTSLRAPCVLLLVVLFTSSPAALAVDLFGVHSASKEMHTAVTELNTTVSALPAQLQDTIGVSIKALGTEVEQIIDKLQDETIPILNDAIVTDIDHTADVVRALAEHLDEIGRQDAAKVDEDAKARIKKLTAMLKTLQARLDGEIKDWIEQTRESVIHVEAKAEEAIVHTTRRWVLDAIRGTAVLLFLIGLLLLGLRLVGRVPPPKITRHGKIEFAAALVIVGCFLAVSLALAIRPQMLGHVTVRTTTNPRETPCHRMQRQMTHLDEAKAVGSAQLAAATERRIAASRAECLGKDAS